MSSRGTRTDLRTGTRTSPDGTTIAYDVAGDGPPLVYVTGAACSRRFKPVVADATTFATTFRTLTYDRRGRGDSGGRPGDWSLERELDDLEAMIEELGGEAFVYGHSSGAVIALHAARRMPSRVRAAVLYDAPWVGDEASRADYAGLRTEVETLLDHGRDGDALRRFLAGIGMPRIFMLLMRPTPAWRTMVATAPSLRHDLALTADLPPLDVAAEVEVPVHLVVGERSPSEIHRVARQLHDAVPGASLTSLPRQDHLVRADAMLAQLVSTLLHP